MRVLWLAWRLTSWIGRGQASPFHHLRPNSCARVCRRRGISLSPQTPHRHSKPHRHRRGSEFSNAEAYAAWATEGPSQRLSNLTLVSTVPKPLCPQPNSTHLTRPNRACYTAPSPFKPKENEPMNDATVLRNLRSMGMTCFVEYFHEFADESLSRQDLIELLLQEED